MKLYVTQGSGNSVKPVLALQQTGKTAELVFLDVLGGQTRRPEFMAVNPAGSVPFLVTEAGEKIGQSNAIVWYVCEGTALMPSSPAHRAQTLQWMIYEQTALEPFISPARFFTTILPHMAESKAEDIIRWQEKARHGLAFLDAHLKGRAFLTDHGYGAADIAVHGYTHLADQAGIALADYGSIGDWIARIAEQPGYQSIGTLLDPSRGTGFSG